MIKIRLMTVQLSGSCIGMYIYILLRVCTLQLLREPSPNDSCLSPASAARKKAARNSYVMMVVSDLASAKSCSALSARASFVSASTFTLRRRWHQRLSRPCPPVWHTRRPHGLPRLAAQSAEVKVTHACVEAETCARCCQRRCRRAPMLGRGRRRVSVRSTGASCFPAPALVPLIGGDARF